MRGKGCLNLDLWDLGIGLIVILLVTTPTNAEDVKLAMFIFANYFYTMDLSKQLENNPDYIKRVNDSVNDLKSNFNKVKEFINKPLTDDNFNEAFKLFLEIFDVIPLLTFKPNLRQIVRGRPHYPHEPLCDARWQISYNWRYRENIKLGRFNQQGEPLFYGSIPTESEEIDYVLSSSLECCKELSIEYDAPNVQDVTLGGWIIQEPFTLVVLCFDNIHLENNPELKGAVNNHLKAINKNLSADAANLIEEILRYLSELSRTKMDNNECYRVLAPLFGAIRFYYENYNKEPLYGLIYPSAMTMAKGLNIVITREAVKSFLKLDKVVIYRYCSVEPENINWKADKCSDIVKVKGHKFTITNYKPPGRY